MAENNRPFGSFFKALDSLASDKQLIFFGGDMGNKPSGFKKSKKNQKSDSSGLYPATSHPISRSIGKVMLLTMAIGLILTVGYFAIY